MRDGHAEDVLVDGAGEVRVQQLRAVVVVGGVGGVRGMDGWVWGGWGAFSPWSLRSGQSDGRMDGRAD